MVIIEQFRKIKIQKTSDLILYQIRDLIEKGELKPGDKLPSQVSLAKKFGVRRNQVRDVFIKLELFEVIKNKPQIGAYITDIGPIALVGIISNILRNERNENEDDFNSLIDARRVLEIRIVQLVAKNATEQEIDEIIKCHKDLSSKIHSGVRGLDEDIYWHLKLAGFSQNYYLIKNIMVLAPRIIEYSRKYTISNDKRLKQLLDEHWEIVKAIKERDERKAGEAMNYHMEMTLNMNRVKVKRLKGLILK